MYAMKIFPRPETNRYMILLNLLVVIMHGLDPDHAIGALPPNMPLKRTDQDVQLAKEGAARLDHVRLTKEDWGQKRIVMAAGKAFDRVDVHANGQIDSNELLVALTQLCVERVTLKVAHSIIDKYSFAGTTVWMPCHVLNSLRMCWTCIPTVRKAMG